MSESNINDDSSNDKSEVIDDIEKDIVGLKQLLHFAKAKLQLIKLDSLNDAYNKDTENVDLVGIKESLLELTKNKHLIHGVTQNVITNDFLRTHVIDMKTSDPACFNYKEKIIEQLELLKTTSVQINDLHGKQCKLDEERRQIQKQLIDQDYQLKRNLEEAIGRREDQKQLNSSYKEQMEMIQLRIKKINFMRTITNRLLDGQIELLKHPDDLVEILQSCRSPCNIEELLE